MLNMNHEPRIMNPRTRTTAPKQGLALGTASSVRGRQGLQWLGYVFISMILYSVFLIPRSVQAQVIAMAVEQRSWTIDAATAQKGITLSNVGERLRIAFIPGSAAAGTHVELTTFASEYFVKGEGIHRVTPIYRVVVNDGANPHPASSHPLPQGEGSEARGEGKAGEFPIEIRYPEEELGKKSVRVWGDDDVWREVPSQNAAKRNAVRASVPAGTIYLAVFSDDKVLETGIASWYSYKNCHCAASPDYPKGTALRVTNVENGKSVVVRVNDYGPDRSVHPDRVIDLDIAAFEHLADPRLGVVRVKVEKVNK